MAFLAAYTFYAVWHSEEVVQKPAPLYKEKKIDEDLADKIRRLKNPAVVPSETPSETLPPAQINTKQESEEVVFKSAQKIEEETEAFYESQIPEGMEEADEAIEAAFSEFDERVAEQDEEERELIESLEQTQEE